MPTALIPVVAAEVWREYPEYRALSVVARNFHPAAAPPPPGTLTPPVWMVAHLESWRAAFRRFGANPKKTPSSVEALWKRVEKSGALPAIDPLVDLYNSLSVRFAAPFGGEDLDRYEGVPRLVIAAGTEPFDTVRDGAPTIEQAEPKEVIWRDDRGITCRRWNWRQCKRTSLTSASTNLWFIIDRLPPMPVHELMRAGEELVLGLHTMCPSVEITTALLQPPA
jgi:DNA/RNA-binding domain of Phe-tRNA-synthetase-like protein